MASNAILAKTRNIGITFPAAQTAKITAMFADRAKLEAMPVHEFVAAMVKNS